MDAVPTFGAWLRRRRNALDLTREVLAARVSCSVVTIRKLEGDAQRPSRQLAERLAAQLAIPAEELDTFVRFARQGLDAVPPELPMPAAACLPPTPDASSQRWEHQAGAKGAGPGHANNLPVQPTSFIGRGHELVVLRERLLDPQTRLLTLTGPGGVGKTRLALQVAGMVLADFADGVWFVDLAPIRDAGLVASTIVQTLGLSEVSGEPILETLRRYLQDKCLLLVLDNFEQVVSAAAVVDSVLRCAPHLKVLVTSRFVVGVYGEHDVVVAPLALPDPQLLAVERLRDVDAIRLFVERAQAAKADFTLSQANAEAVVGICRRLDGLPLAIELAAARIRHFPPQLLCTRLDRRLAVLTGGARTLAPRQQTLRNTIDWTYQLLSPAEQSLFACLGVFVGGCTVEAAEAVCRGADDRSADTLDALASLVDKRLLRQSEGVGGEARFTMLETIREYSLERLAMIGETETLRRCHAAYYRTIVRPMRGWTMMPEHEAWLPHFEQEHDNLRAALRWSIDQGEIETAARIALALWWCWNTRGYTGEAYRWFEQILARRSALPEPRQAQVLNVAGFLGWLQGDLHRAEELHHESLRLSRSLGDRVESAYALMYLGRLAATRGNYLGAETQHQAALEIFRAIGDDYGLVVALRSLGEILVELGEHERATVLLHESLPINTRFGDKAEIGWTWYYLGRAAEAEDDPAQAEALLQRSLDLFRDIGFLDGQARAAHALGLLAQSHGDYRQAEALYRDSLALLRGSGYNTGIMMVVEAMAGLAVAQDRPRRAARLFGAAEHLRESYSAPLEPCMRARHACHVAAARAQLDQVSWETACSEGQVMPLEQAIRYALEGID